MRKTFKISWQAFLLFLLCWLSPKFGFTQLDSCSINASFEIYSQDYSEISIQVQGLQNADLGVNQFLCGVEVYFEHSRLENVRIELISPAGQAITLIGPGEINADPSGLIRWNLNFIPCAAPANPDPGIAPIWDNSQAFQLFTEYEGFYYPNNGCLEDFDMGSANGWWTFVITDLGEFGAGTISHIELIFCDNTGISCELCNPYAGRFINTPLTICELDQNIFSIEDFYESFPDTIDNDFELRFLVFTNDVLTDVLTELDFSGLSVGNYLLCGMVISADQIDQFDAASWTLQSLLNATTENSICADITDNCLPLTVVGNSSSMIVDTILCRGDTITFEGIQYTAAIDTTLLVFDGDNGICRPTQLSIVESDLIVSFVTSGAIDCGGGEIFINALGSFSTAAPVDYIWTTDNGSYTSDQGPIAGVDAPGDYLLTVDDGFCRDSIELNIPSAMNGFDISLSSDSLNCDLDPIEISVNTLVDIDSFFWDGVGLIEPPSLNAMVDQPGTYELLAFANGCSETLTIEVPLTQVPLDFDFALTPGNCIVDTSILEINTSIPDPIITITGPGDIYNLDPLNFVLDSSGFFTITVSNASMICTDSLEIKVDKLLSFPWTTLSEETSLSCLTQEAILDLVVLAPEDHTIIWEGVGGFSSTIDQPTVTEAGWYYVSITDDISQCITIDSILVQNASGVPPMLNFQDSIAHFCPNPFGILLDPELDTSAYDFAWNGPDVINESTPVLNTNNVEGVYILTVTDRSSLCQAKDTIVIYPEDILPVQIQQTGSNCNGDPVMLCHDANDIEQTWFLDNVFFSNDECIQINQSGQYILEVSSDSTGCIGKDTLDFDQSLGFQVTLSISGETCSSANDGTISIINISGQTGSVEVFLDGEEQGLVEIGNLSPGIYELTIIDELDCIWTQMVDVPAGNGNLTITTVDTIYTSEGTSLNLQANTNIDSNFLSTIQWSGDGSFSCATCLTTSFVPEMEQTISIEVSNVDSCFASSQIVIIFESNTDVYIPTGFSPNADFNNDKFGIAITEDMANVSLSIYDRWGNLVFNAEDLEPDDPNAQWNGDYGTTQVNPGIYVYFAKIDFVDGNSITAKGALTLVR